MLELLTRSYGSWPRVFWMRDEGEPSRVAGICPSSRLHLPLGKAMVATGAVEVDGRGVRASLSVAAAVGEGTEATTGDCGMMRRDRDYSKFGSTNTAPRDPGTSTRRRERLLSTRPSPITDIRVRALQ